MSKDLRLNNQSSFYLLSGDVKAAKEGEWKVTVNKEALQNILAAYDAAVAECTRVTGEWEAHTRPEDLSWYDKDEEGDRLSERDDVARDVLEKLTGE